MPERSLLIINRISLSIFVLVLLDITILGGSLRKLLPTSITSISWYYYIFGLPHIIGSYVSYCSPDYIATYKKKLLIHFAGNALLLFFILLLVPSLFIYFFIAYTMYHVAWQQLGLSRRYVTNSSTLLYRIWGYSGVATAIIMALSVGGEARVNISLYTTAILQTFGSLAVCIFLIAGIFLWKKKEYLITTTFILVFASVAILLGYYILGILMIRLTHDVTAFTIYSNHDVAHKKSLGTNYLYRFFKVPPEYIYIFLPLISIVIAYLLQFHVSILLYLIIVLLSLTHYSMESKIWKRGTLHRTTLG